MSSLCVCMCMCEISTHLLTFDYMWFFSVKTFIHPDSPWLSEAVPQIMRGCFPGCILSKYHPPEKKKQNHHHNLQLLGCMLFFVFSVYILFPEIMGRCPPTQIKLRKDIEEKEKMIVKIKCEKTELEILQEGRAWREGIWSQLLLLFQNSVTLKPSWTLWGSGAQKPFCVLHSLVCRK